MSKDAGKRGWSSFWIVLTILIFPYGPGEAYFGKTETELCQPPEPEAGLWLEKNGQTCFAYRGRCRGPQNADVLVERLYREGSVFVGLIFSGRDPVGLRVYLPLDQDKREEIFRVANEALEAMRFSPFEDHGQNEISIWFP